MKPEKRIKYTKDIRVNVSAKDGQTFYIRPPEGAKDKVLHTREEFHRELDLTLDEVIAKRQGPRPSFRCFRCGSTLFTLTKDKGMIVATCSNCNTGAISVGATT